jgi:hypothetical protein
LADRVFRNRHRGFMSSRCFAGICGMQPGIAAEISGGLATRLRHRKPPLGTRVAREGFNIDRDRQSGLKWLAPPAAPTPPAATSHKPNEKQEHHSADRGVDDRADNAGAELNPKLGQQPSPDKSTKDSYNQIADQTKAGPSYELPGEPSGHKTDE